MAGRLCWQRSLAGIAVFIYWRRSLHDYYHYYWHVSCDNDTKSHSGIIVDKLQFRDWVNRWLNAIPYAALGALIFPGILSVNPDQPYIGLIGGLVAITLALIGLNVILVVVGAIGAVFFLSVLRFCPPPAGRQHHIFRTTITRPN